MKKISLLLLLLASLSMLTSCNIPQRDPSLDLLDKAVLETSVAATLTSIHQEKISQTPIAKPATTTYTPTPFDFSTATPTPSVTPTLSLPTVYFDSNVNCRTGPGTEYSIVVLVKEGSTAEIMGSNGAYWIIQPPGRSDTCWVPAEFVTPEGSFWIVGTMTQPATPTPIPPNAPGWKSWYYSCSYQDGQSILTMEMEWIDKSNDEEGFRVLRDDDVIAEFPANTTTHIDVVNIESGQKFNYQIQVFSGTAHAEGSVITASCDD